MEKKVSIRVMWYLESNHLLSDAQFGFRSNRSTIDQLILIEKEIQNSFSHRNQTVAVFSDLEKAFDTTWRFNILDLLQKWGLKERLPSFLKQREFCVRNTSTSSELHILENGVPQGSTLSVVLFAIAVNGLLDNLDPAVGRCLYVDDSTIFHSASSMDDIERTLQGAIDSFRNQANALQFTFSAAKTNCVHFFRLRSVHNDPKLKLSEHELGCSDSIKFLGIIFGRKLRWDLHTNDLILRG
ncbi:hypothetical protein JTB14_037709 [Gonioctena quinquepunctata]|nr:hypothetical protein JTB14_037709 [Gonioctena quinquepunctata]